MQPTDAPVKRVIGRPFPKGVSGNPGGALPKTDAQREAEEILRAETPAAARRLIELERSTDKKVALGATQAHLRLTIGEKLRNEVGGAAHDAFAELVAKVRDWPADKVIALALAERK